MIKNSLLRAYKAGAESSLDLQDEFIKHEVKNLTTIPYIKSLILEHLAESYSEGYFSSDKEGDDNNKLTVECIYNRCITELGPLVTLLDIPTLYNNVPDTIKEIFVSINTSKPNIWLAGGSVLELILNEKWTGDYDLYCDSDIYNTLTRLLSKMSCEVMDSNTGYGALTLKFKKLSRPIHLVVGNFTSPYDVMQSFDFTICQFAINHMLPCVYCSTDALEDLNKKVIKLNPSCQSLNPMKIVDRINKYKSRGFIEDRNLRTKIDKFLMMSAPIKMESECECKYQDDEQPSYAKLDNVFSNFSKVVRKPVNFNSLKVKKHN